MIAVLLLSFLMKGQDEPKAFLEMKVPQASYFTEESVPLRFRIGLNQTFLAESAIQLFRQEMDIPVQVSASWLESLSSLSFIKTVGAEPTERTNLALNEMIFPARRVSDTVDRGVTYVVHEFDVLFVAKQPGTVEIPSAILRYAYATEFREDFINGRVPVDRHDASVVSPSLIVRIDPLPTIDQPASFTGGVGEFIVESRLDRDRVEAGETLTLTFRVTGEGNVSTLGAPSLKRWTDFHVYGRIDHRSDRTCEFTYDLAPLSSDVDSVPPIEFSYFDPQEKHYVTLRTEPIPINVTGGTAQQPSQESSSNLIVPGENDIFDETLARASFGSGSVSNLGIALGILGPWLLGCFLWFAKRRLEYRRSHPEHLRAQRAASRFRRNLRRGHDITESYTGFLADRLGCSQAAVVSPTLPNQLEVAAVPKKLAHESAQMLENLVATRFDPTPSGPDESNHKESVCRLVRALEQSFRNGSSS